MYLPHVYSDKNDVIEGGHAAGSGEFSNYLFT